MTTDRDLDRVLGVWFGEGPTAAPDRMLDVMADRIGRQHQRPTWLIDRPRRSTRRSILRVALVAALAAGVVGGAILFSSGVPMPIPTPPPTPSPVASPTPFPLDAPADYTLTPGAYRFTFNGGGTTVVLPEGWAVPTLGDLDFSLRPTGLGANDTVRVFFDMRVASRDAACTEAVEPGVGSSSAEIIGALASDPALDTTVPQPIKIGGLDGLMMDVRLARDWTRDCPFTPHAPGRPILVDTVPGVGPFWGIDRFERERIIVLDHPAARNVTLLIDSADGTTYDLLVARAMRVLESLDFDLTPPPSPIPG